MSCWALIPIKQRSDCKSRLSDRLAPSQRLRLVLAMLERVIGAARQARSVDAIAFVSAERDTIPTDIPVLEDPGRGLNAALTSGRESLRRRGCRELIVLPADLPLITADDIDALVAAGRRTGMSVAPDRAGSGTNALCLPAEADFEFQFGAGSRRRHQQEALRVGTTMDLVSTPGLQVDIDDGADLDLLLSSRDPRFLCFGEDPEVARWMARPLAQFG